MRALRLAWRMLRRDARGGELRLLAAALATAVAALTAVGFSADRVRLALESESHQLLAADLVFASDHPPSPALLALPREGVRQAQTLSFPSMVAHAAESASTRSGALAGTPSAARTALADIKAVSEGYPLRGALRTAPALNAADQPASGGPPRGTVWLDERLALALAAQRGDRIAVGKTELAVDAVLTQEPDRGVSFFSVAPRLLMNLADLDATGLVQPGARVAWRLLLAGDAAALATWRDAATPLLGRGERLEDAQSGRPEIRSALDRASSFLGLAALLTAILAAVAVALAARRYAQRHLDACAVMRCLGATQADLLWLFGSQFVLLGVLASALGCVVGYAAHFVLHAAFAQLLETSLPAPGWRPAAQGFVLGLVLLLAFAAPPLLQLRRVPTLRVLRRELGAPAAGLFGGFAVGALALAAVMLWIAGDIRLGAFVFGGFAVALLVFAGVARLLVRAAAALVRRLPTGAGGHGWRQGILGLERRAGASVVQISALAIGVMALLLLTTIRGDLLTAWRGATPADAPNRFVINIQPDELDAVRAYFEANGLRPEFAPMVRGRLVRLNDADITAESFTDERAQRLIDREFNLSWRDTPPAGNTLLAGRWFSPADRGHGVVSVEEGLARTLGIHLGDRLAFDVGGEMLSVEVVALRKLDWDSMRVNFFVLAPSGVLETFSTSWITAFHLPPADAAFVNRLVGEFPTLTVIDVAAILRQLQAILDLVSRAIEFVFLFTVLAGLIVLWAALVSAADERRYELALLRALGARRSQLAGALLAEYAAIGATAGLIASAGAMAVGAVLAAKVFHVALPLALGLPFIATGGGALLVAGTGWLAAARLLRAPPLLALRAGV
ncbi:ABC transporter permease [Rhodocyclus gracilis]|nr:FtsX-like permease family protein [Rhodocyclus gracilis]